MDNIPMMPSSGASGGDPGGLATGGMYPNLDIYYPPRGTTPGAEGPKLENLGNVADTWGKAIPFTAGNIRVKAYQIWSSPFYEDKDTSTVVNNPKYPDITTYEVLPLMDGAATPSNNVSYAQPVTDIEKFFNAYIDVAYSAGYNMLLTSRIVGEIKFDGTPVYSYETRSNKFSFGFHDGVLREKDPLIEKDLGDDTTYFPDQNYLVFKELSLSTTNGALPKDVEVLFRVSELVGNAAEREDFDEAINVVTGLNLPDWANRKLYVYVKGEGDYGKIYHYDIDTLELIDDYPVVIQSETYLDGEPTGGEVLGGFDVVLWFPNQELLVAQQTAASPGFAQAAAIFAVNIRNGEQKARYGRNSTDFDPEPGSILFMETGVECGKAPNYGTWTYVNNPYRTSYFCGVSGNADSDVTITVEEREEWEGGALAGNLVKGTNAIGYLIATNRDIYAAGMDGISLIVDNPTHTYDNYTVSGNDLIGFTNDGRVTRWDSSGNVVYDILNDWDSIYSTIDVGYSFNKKITQYPDISNNTIGFGTGNKHVAVFNLGTGDLEYYVSAPNRWTQAQLWESQSAKLYVLQAHGGDELPLRGIIQLPYRQLGGEILLRDFMRAVFVSTGRFTAEQITFEETIDYTVLGGGIFQSTTIGAVIKDICAVYRIDYMETETGIHFYHNRFIASSADILATVNVTELALVSEGSSDNPTDFSSILDNSISASAEIALSFIDPDADYTTNTVRWTNPNADFNSNGTAQFTVPLVITKNTALTLVRALYTDSNTTKTRHIFRLPRSMNYYSKGDVITIVDGNFRETVRITQTDFNADYSVSCEAENVSMKYFEPTTVPDKPVAIRRLSSNTSKTYGIVFDIPALVNSHNSIPAGKLLQYMHLYGDADWQSGYFARKNAQWNTVYKSSKDAKPIVFKAGAPLGNLFWVADDTPLTVESVYGTYDETRNTNYDRLYNSEARNLALYGAAGRWEVVQFAEISDGAVRGILRGLRGTEDAAGKHQTGDLFVLVSQAFTRENRPVANVGNTVLYRSVTVGGSLLASPAISHKVEGNSLKPYAPFNVKASFVTNDILITWNRRDRSGNGWGVTPPMSENTEAYEIDIYSGASVVRTLTSNTQQVTYTEAQQIADGLGGTTELTLCVYQISADVGRGFGNKVTVNVS